MKKIMLAVILLVAIFSTGAFASEEKVVKVEKGDCLSQILKANGISPTINNCKKVADFNGIANMHFIKIGQVVKLNLASSPSVLKKAERNPTTIKTSKTAKKIVVRLGVNPTTIPNNEAIAKVITAAKRDPNFARKYGIVESYFLPTASQAMERMNNDGKLPYEKNSVRRIYDLGDEKYRNNLFLVTEGKGRVVRDVGMPNGKRIEAYAGKKRINRSQYILIGIIIDCQNAFLTVCNIEKENGPIPELPMACAPPTYNGIRSVSAQKDFSEKYRRIDHEMLEDQGYVLDISGGENYQKYDNGSQDVSRWSHTALRREYGPDANGRSYAMGPYVNAGNWEGDWTDPAGRAPKFDFDGERYEYGVESLIYDNAKQYKAKIGYVTENGQGASKDFWGRSSKKADMEGVTAGIKMDDNSRREKNFLSRYSVGLGYTYETNGTATRSYTDRFGKTTVERDNETIQGVSASAELDIYKKSDKLCVSVEGWGILKENDDKIAKVTPFIGFLNNSLKVGYQVTEANYAGEGHLSGKGLAWQVHLYDLYKYIEEKSASRPSEVKEGEDVLDNPDGFINQKQKQTKAPQKNERKFNEVCSYDGGNK